MEILNWLLIASLVARIWTIRDYMDGSRGRKGYGTDWTITYLSHLQRKQHDGWRVIKKRYQCSFWDFAGCSFQGWGTNLEQLYSNSIESYLPSWRASPIILSSYGLSHILYTGIFFASNTVCYLYISSYQANIYTTLCPKRAWYEPHLSSETAMFFSSEPDFEPHLSSEPAMFFLKRTCFVYLHLQYTSINRKRLMTTCRFKSSLGEPVISYTWYVFRWSLMLNLSRQW